MSKQHPWRKSTKTTPPGEVRRIAVYFRVEGVTAELQYNAWATSRKAAEEEFWRYIDNDNTISRSQVTITG